MAGETEVTTQLAAEQTEMIRAKRPPAGRGRRQAARDRRLRHDPAAVADFIPGFKDPINYFGIFVPKGVPPKSRPPWTRSGPTDGQQRGAEEVRLQPRRAVRAHGRRRRAAGRHVPGHPGLCLDAAGAGKAKVSPDTVGIPKP
jgi:hypothetical protein